MAKKGLLPVIDIYTALEYNGIVTNVLENTLFV